VVENEMGEWSRDHVLTWVYYIRDYVDRLTVIEFI
jgi:hypothetical protein